MLSLSFLFTATGRVTRLQYWLSFLLYLVLIIVLGVGMMVLGIGGAGYTHYLARAHDSRSAAPFEEAGAPVVGEAAVEKMATSDDLTSDPASVAAVADAVASLADQTAETLDEPLSLDQPFAADDAAPDRIEPLGGVGPLLVSLLGLFLAMALIYSSIVVQIKRWHDQNLPGWMVLINFTGVGTLVTFIMCGFLRGTAGPNPYGADPLATA